MNRDTECPADEQLNRIEENYNKTRTDAQLLNEAADLFIKGTAVLSFHPVLRSIREHHES